MLGTIRTRMTHARLFLAAVATACVLTAQAATPEEDFKTGQETFDRGDVVTAMAPLKRAADAGHSGAQALYAYILDKSENDVEAVSYYRKSVAQGDPEGMFGLAGMLFGGEGVDQNIPEARALIQEAAEKGHEQATIAMALSYLTVTDGVTEEQRRSPEAGRWIAKAAELKYLPAMTALLAAYATGDYGLRPDAAAEANLAEQIKELKGTDDEPKRRRRRR